MTLVQTEPPSAYIKKGGKVGRTKAVDMIVEKNTNISEFFTSAGNNQRLP